MRISVLIEQGVPLSITYVREEGVPLSITYVREQGVPLSINYTCLDRVVLDWLKRQIYGK